MFSKLNNPSQSLNAEMTLLEKNRKRFDSIISDSRCNYLAPIYNRLFEKDQSLTDAEISTSYLKFSDSIQTNSYAAAELELVAISVLCYFRPNLTETLIRRGLLAIVASLGDDIDWFTVLQFIEIRIIGEGIEPYGGLPPEQGIVWLTNILPNQKEILQRVLQEVILANQREIDQI